MRVLHTIDSVRAEVGGPSHSVPMLVRALRSSGVDAFLWTYDRKGPRDLSPSGISAEMSLEDVLNGDRKIDVLHDHGIWRRANHQAARLAAIFDVPRMVSPRGMLEPWALSHRKWKKRVSWWLYQRKDIHSAAALHATAEMEAAQFRALGIALPVHIVPNALDLSDISVCPDCPDKEKKIVLFLSRIHPKKGLLMLVDAWAAVNPPNWIMQIVGPDELGHRADVEAKVARMGLKSSWRFQGAAEGQAKWKAMKEADLFVLPTHSENFGICVAEALASKLPVITTKGAPWEGLVTHDCGWWVEPTSDALATALRAAMALTSEQRTLMGEQGRTWIEREFSPCEVGKRMVESYEKTLSCNISR